MRLLTYLLSIVVLFALADASVAQVRYSVAEIPRAAPASAKAAGLRTLTWPGKTAIAQPAPPQPVAAPVAPRPMARALPAPPVAPAPQAYAPPPPYPTAPPLPTSIYAPAPPPAASLAPRPPTPPTPPAAPPVKALAMVDPNAPTSARHYSLHRQYGGEPDPIPLTPQFFESSSQDLAAPPPPIARPQTTATGRVIRPAPADPDAGGLQGQ